LGWGLWEAFNRVRTFHHERFPGAIIEAEDLHSDAQSEALQEGHIDVGFCWGVRNSVHLTSETIFKAQVIVLMSSANPLAQRKAVSLRDLADEMLILVTRGRSPNNHDKAIALYSAAGVTPNIITAPHTPSGIKNMIASGVGIHLGTISPFVQPYSYHSGITLVPLNEPNATVDVLMTWRQKERSNATLGFVRSGRETFEEVPLNDSVVSQGAGREKVRLQRIAGHDVHSAAARVQGRGSLQKVSE
jgi:DNA-binding transcriptional LysR family regulator